MLGNVAELISQTFDRLSDHDSLIGPTTVTAVELAAESHFADIPRLVEVALERILPRFDQDAAEVVTSAIAALPTMLGQRAGRQPAGRPMFYAPRDGSRRWSWLPSPK